MHMKKRTKPPHGFTLIELMIAMAIFSIASAALYASYQAQQHSYHTQEQVSDMQQNLRAALFFIERDVKMAGYDPREKADAASNANNIARVAEFRFARDRDYQETGGEDLDGDGAFDDDDLDGDGVIDDEDGKIQNDEYIRYALTNDANRDGIADGAPCHLGRQIGINGALDPVADNVDAMEFVYHLADGTVTRSPANPEDIRSIEISLLVRTDETIRGYIDTATYFPASHYTSGVETVWGPFNDSRQRKLLITEVKCRNLGVL